jgi:predicted transcriptional regulator
MNIRDRTRRNQPFYAFDLGEKVYVWIYSRGSKGFALNRYVPLESKARFDFFELMGAFHCEGKKARKKGEKNLDSMIFGNGDPEQILWFAESLEQFGFSKKDFRLQILHNKTQDVELLRDFWLSRGFFQDKVNLYENETVKSEKGVCLLAISGVVIGELFHELLEIAKRLAVRNKQNALRFFRGLSRGDIGISASRGKIGSISYTTENHENAVFFRNICRKIDIESSKEFFTPGVKGFWSVNITGYNNFKKLLLNGAIAHSKRKRKLLRLFFGMRNSRLDEYLKTVKDGKLTSRKIADALSISIVSSRAFLQKLRREGYVKKKNIGQAFRYSLTVNGVKRLVEFERIKKEMAG